MNLRRLRVGAVCPPRAPPECFSWLGLAVAKLAPNPRHVKFATFLLRGRAPPAHAGNHQAPIKKGAQKPPFLNKMEGSPPPEINN